MKKYDIKPCPFCGEADKLGISNKTTTINHKRKRHVAVYCKSCNAYGPRLIAEEISFPEFCTEDAILKAITLWNDAHVVIQKQN